MYSSERRMSYTPRMALRVCKSWANFHFKVNFSFNNVINVIFIKTKIKNLIKLLFLSHCMCCRKGTNMMMKGSL